MKVYTGGTFDLLHRGHVEFLRKCNVLAGLGGRVIIGLNTDEFVASYKRPTVMTYEERRDVLHGCKWVYDVVENTGGPLSGEAIETVAPDAVAIGSDWARRDYYTQMGITQDWLDVRNIILCYVPYTADISSTSIRERLCT
jgi:glycerol-3-phosphate cytidylyltransferase